MRVIRRLAHPRIPTNSLELVDNGPAGSPETEAGDIPIDTDHDSFYAEVARYCQITLADLLQ